MHQKISLAIHAVLSDDTLDHDDRVRVADAALRVYQAAKISHPKPESDLAKIIRKAMRDAPHDCGCVGPRAGQKYCRCEIQSHLTIAEAEEAIMALFTQAGARWRINDWVSKKSGSSWRGRVCGFYRTALTPVGYAIESHWEPGSVQIFPEAALAPWKP